MKQKIQNPCWFLVDKGGNFFVGRAVNVLRLTSNLGEVGSRIELHLRGDF